MRNDLARASIRPTRTILPISGTIAAGAFSHLGNALSAIVYPWLVFDLTGSAAMMGIMAAVVLLPAAAGALFGGVVVDRLGVRGAALIAGVANAASALAIALLAATGSLTFGLLLALAGLGAVLDGLGVIAFEARLPELSRLARAPLMRVNVIDDFIDNGAAIIGPGIGALLIAAVSTTGALASIAALAIAALMMTLASLPAFRPRRAPAAAPIADALVGARYLFGDPPLRTMLLLGIVGMSAFIAADGVILPAILRADGRPALDLAAFVTASALGAIAINLALAWLRQTLDLRFTYASAFLGLTAAFAILLFDRSTVALAGAGFLLGLSAGPVPPVFTTILQSCAPKAIRGRVLGTSAALLLTGAPLAAVAAGYGIETLGPTVTLAACCAALTGCLTLAFRLPRRIEKATAR